jgi:DNA-binding transcriptional ArsR family regulator
MKHLGNMTRDKAVTQHLDLLEAANLVATVRRGREKLHFLNPVPLQAIYERLDCQVRKAAPQGTLGSQTTTGEDPWLDRPLST